MPNHVINEVTLRDVPLRTTLPIISSDEREIDFEVLLPMPLNIWQGNTGHEHMKAFPNTWYDWCWDNWGTKWNAYNAQIRERDGSTVLTFQTAWEPPRGWIVALFNTLKCDIDHLWLDEGADDAFREMYIASGPCCGTSVIENGTDDHRRLDTLQEQCP